MPYDTLPHNPGLTPAGYGVDFDEERERWEANVAMWTVKMKKTVLEADDLDIMRKQFATMKANVAKITDAAEKERWDANVAMWEVVMAAPGKSSARLWV